MNVSVNRSELNNTRFRFCMMMLIGITTFLCACSPASQKTTSNAQYAWNIPAGFPAPQVPADNPMSVEKVALGRALFYEPALSINKAMSCSTCHQIERAFSQALPTSSGATGQSLRRNALALVNIGYNSEFTWAHNGLESIEQQMMIPLFSDAPIEMGAGGNHQAIIKRFQTDDYKQLFKAAFGDESINFDRIVKAIASFVRSLTSFNSAFDDYAYRDQDDALNDAELRGMELFFSERLECFHCHGGFNFTQSSKHELQTLDLQPFHNTGLYNVDEKGAYPSDDQGLIEISLQKRDMGRYKAPTLRNIALSAPYMHDGSIATLEKVIKFYADGGRREGINNPHKSQFVTGFEINERELNDLLAFLHALSDEEFISRQQNHAPLNPPRVNID